MRQLKISNSITNRDAQSLGKYFQEVKKIEMISPEEEALLAVLIKKGDQTSLDRLVKSNLRFVISVAKQFQHKGLSLSDLINEGNIGLISAARNFDQTRGFKFISYAVWHIRQQIVLAIAENARIIRIPLNKVALRSRIQKANTQLEQKLERPATEEELAEELNLKPEDIRFSLYTGYQHISLDMPLGDDENDSILDLIKNPNATDADKELSHNESLKLEIERSFQVLNERQRETICYFFGIGIDHPMSLDEIARNLYVTPERVRQIKDAAIEKLRTTKSFHLLKKFLAA